MLFCALDKEVTRYYQRTEASIAGEGARTEAGDVEPGLLGGNVDGGEIDDGIADAGAEEEPSMWQEQAFFTRDPTVFWGRPDGMRCLTDVEFTGIQALYERAMLVHARGGGSRSHMAHRLKEIWVEKVKISRGSWFLCRPGGDGLMWFGQVEDVFRHFGCDGEARVLVKAEWYWHHVVGRSRGALQPPSICGCVALSSLHAPLRGN